MLSRVAIDKRRIDLLHQYAMVVAADEDDWRSRELGPIHLVKYAYLADWAHARRHGVTFTSAEWQFHHFGPWHVGVYERIEPALEAIHCERKSISSRYQDDFIRFTLQERDEILRERLEAELPIGVVAAIQNAVRQFGSDTASLLRHAYLTPPMLNAAPGEFLDLTRTAVPAVAETASVDRLSSKEKRQRKEIIKQLKQKVQERLRREPKAETSTPAILPPRYDELFVAGTEWLDVMAGEPPHATEGELLISPEIWKSPTRSDPDVP